ncbi:MAG: hypothetical protein WCI74_05175, partial [Actinomycetes bacterium]
MNNVTVRVLGAVVAASALSLAGCSFGQNTSPTTPPPPPPTSATASPSVTAPITPVPTTPPPLSLQQFAVAAAATSNYGQQPGSSWNATNA